MKFLGIDGCKRGWVAVEVTKSANALRFSPEVHLVERLSDFKGRIKDNLVSYIDMPLGLIPATHYPRSSDVEAKKLLGPRHATLFLSPILEVLECEEYPAANELHKSLTGKGMSKQSWYLLRKIREGMEARTWWSTLYESHPELCFSYLRTEEAEPLSSKHTPEGAAQRKEILRSSAITGFDELHQAVAERGYPNSALSENDLLDACVLAAHAALSYTQPDREIVLGQESKPSLTIRFFDGRK